jgi:putative flippase GtrA
VDKSFLRFVLVGIGNTVVGLAVIYGARQFMSDFLANLVGYMLVTPLSFLSHRNLSFRDRGRRLPAFLRYIVTVVVGYVCNLATLKAALSLDVNPYLAQALSVAVYVGTTYLLSRYLVFRESR